MQPLDVTSISWWITQLGPSGVFLFLCWRVLLWIKPIVESFVPHLRDVLTGHVALMKTMEQRLNDDAVTLEKVSDTQDEQGVKLDAIHKAVVV